MRPTAPAAEHIGGSARGYQGDLRDVASRPKPPYPRTVRALRGGCGTGQEIAAVTSSATFFSTVGLQFFSAYDTGHMSPSSRFAASWKPRVE